MGMQLELHSARHALVVIAPNVKCGALKRSRVIIVFNAETL